MRRSKSRHLVKVSSEGASGGNGLNRIIRHLVKAESDHFIHLFSTMRGRLTALEMRGWEASGNEYADADVEVKCGF